MSRRRLDMIKTESALILLLIPYSDSKRLIIEVHKECRGLMDLAFLARRGETRRSDNRTQHRQQAEDAGEGTRDSLSLIWVGNDLLNSPSPPNRTTLQLIIVIFSHRSLLLMHPLFHLLEGCYWREKHMPYVLLHAVGSSFRSDTDKKYLASFSYKCP